MHQTEISSPVIDGVHTVLVVDDNAGDLALLVRILGRKGYRTESAGSGEAALARARQCNPDLILLDVLMPGIDGYEACRRLKSESALADIPVLFISGRADPVDRLAAFDAGGLDYITKPFDRREVIARVKAHLDIRDLQAELKSRNAQLHAYTERLKELEAHRDELVSMVVHDMRSPMTVINTTLKLLAGTLNSEDRETIEDIRVAQNNAALLSKMADDLLHISRLESGCMELDLSRCDLKDLIDPVIEATRINFPGIEFQLAAEEPEVSINVDANIFERVVGNLLSNAASFSNDEDRVLVEFSSGNGEITIGVIDNGPGVSAEMRNRIFEKFQRGARGQSRRRSVGLGLAFCKLAVEAHGGNIGVESQPGTGSRFWFTLPTSD